MAECIYFRYEDETPWHGDVFDHPYYKYYCLRYYCLKNGKNKEIFSWTCSKCPYYEEEKTMIHKMIACSEECLRLACCDFCKYVIQDYFFNEDKDGNIVGDPIMGSRSLEDWKAAVEEALEKINTSK